MLKLFFCVGSIERQAIIIQEKRGEKCRSLAGGGSGRRRNDPAAADQQYNQRCRTQQQIGGSPAHCRAEQTVDKVAHDEGAAAKAHEQHTGGKALFIG